MKKTKQIAGTLAGNAMEFYDFTIYAFLTPYLGKAFFSFENIFLSYLMAFGVFASGFLTRPFGALLFGYIGDQYGRSKALSISIIISTIATFSIGLIPSYSRVGTISSFILIGLRLLQGLAVSGEGGAIVLLFEKYSFKDRGLIGGSVLASTLGGVILGSIVCAFTSCLITFIPIETWLWRIPFLLSLPLGITAILWRYLLNDFQLFELATRHHLKIKYPFVALIKNYSLTILYSVMIVSLFSITTSVFIIHFPYLLTEKLAMSHYGSLFILTGFLTFIAIMTPVLGNYFSAYNPVHIYSVTVVFIAIIAPIWFYYLSISNLPGVLLTTFVFSLLIAAISSVLFPIFVGVFPFGVRYSGVAFSFNISITLFSSSTPMAMLFLEHYFNTMAIAGIYISFFAILVLICTQLLSKHGSMINFNQTEKELVLYS